MRNIGITGWQVWRDLSAPVLPFYLLWGQFIESELKRLENAASKSGDGKALTLHSLLTSLALRLQKLNPNPFMDVVKAAGTETVIAVEDAERANALEKFLKGNLSPSSIPQILPMREICGKSGEKLIVIGQPKAHYRDILQTTFFHQIDVLLWSVLSERAERWWSSLEIDAREWHRKTWMALSEQQEVGYYSFSPENKLVQVINTGTAKLSKNINLLQLEESFSTLPESRLD